MSLSPKKQQKEKPTVELQHEQYKWSWSMSNTNALRDGDKKRPTNVLKCNEMY